MKLATKRCLTIGVLTLALGACSETDSDDDNDDETASGTVGSSGTSSSSNDVDSASNVADLQLTSAFSLDLPDALEATDSGSSLALTSGRRSREACMVGETVSEVTRALDDVGNFFCHIEAEQDNIVFGQKTRITFEGQEFAKIWIDDSEAGRIRIGFCQAGDEHGAHSEIIDITGLSDHGPSGIIINKGTHTEQDENGDSGESSFHRSVTFDMSVEGVASLQASDKHTFGDNAFNRHVVLTLRDTGASSAAVAARGTWHGSAFEERGYALLNAEYGSAALEHSGTHEGNEFSHRNKAFFDKDGLVVGPDATTAFAAGGELHIAESDLPEYLAEDFSPTDLDGWVGDGCPDYDSEITLDPESEAHQACDGDRNRDHANCWDSDEFEQGDDL